MQIKFKKSIKDFKYLVMFDLASINTGVCLWDLKKNEPILTQTLRVRGERELPAVELLELIIRFFNDLVFAAGSGISTEDVLVMKEAMPTQLRGGSSTVQTFLALARSHCTLDTCMFQNEIAVYDYVGIYPSTWHNYFKRIKGFGKDQKVTKEDVHEYVVSKYNLVQDISMDESDAVFMCEAFLNVKWNNDLKERVLEVKRHRKTLKAPHAIKSCDEEIERLNGLKIVDK